MNVLTPVSYVPLQAPQLEVQAQEHLTQSFVIASGTDYLQLESNNGIKLGGKYTTNLQLFGVNNTSSSFQDVEIYI